MRAFGISNYGSIEELKEVELPRPVIEKPFDILVNVKAVSVNPVDTKVRKGGKGGSVNGVRVLGFDASGIVAGVGSSVTKFKPGDEVYYAGDISRQGSNAEFQLVDSRLVSLKPKSLNWGQAAAIPLVALTAMEGLFETLKVPTIPEGAEGKAILVIGGAGGVGSLVVQLVKKLTDLVVIATASRPESTEYLKNLGVDHVISHKSPLAPQLEKLGFPKVKFIYNTQSTDEYFDQAVGVLAPLGRIVLITSPEQNHNLAPLMNVRGQVSVGFMFSRALFNEDIHLQGIHLAHVAKLLDEKGIVAPQTKTIPLTLENLKETHRQLESQTTIGKITLEW